MKMSSTSPKDGDTVEGSTFTAPVVEPKSEYTKNTETQMKETQPDRKESSDEAVDPPPKKSLAFKLAFVGLASSRFVFHLDATALGIALPVRPALSSRETELR